MHYLRVIMGSQHEHTHFGTTPSISNACVHLLLNQAQVTAAKKESREQREQLNQVVCQTLFQSCASVPRIHAPFPTHSLRLFLQSADKLRQQLDLANKRHAKVHMFAFSYTC